LAIAITTSAAWRERYPNAGIGILEIAGALNSGTSAVLDVRKRAVETKLREHYRGFERPQFVAAPVLADYVRYYKSFGKTYHVQLQLESIVLKGKALPHVSPLVDANFVAEVETLVLTAGHDVAKLRPPLVIDVAGSADSMTQMNGRSATMQAGDMLMRDAGGVACSILYGQDNRSPISAATTHALYVAYGVPGVAPAVIRGHLEAVLANVRLFSPGAMQEQLFILQAEPAK
jgi:DNA/RNA-binding domain of Phe-tRNA-synthetase-like protein